MSSEDSLYHRNLPRLRASRGRFSIEINGPGTLGAVTAQEIKGNENHGGTPPPPTNIMTYKFNPTADVADLIGKVAIVTGGK